MKNFGEQFLHTKDDKLHTSTPVEHEKARLERIGEQTSQKPVDKISDWLKVVEKTHMGHQDDLRVLERIKEYYFKQNVIKAEDVPESAFLLEQRIARERGHGNIDITDSYRKEKSDEIISAQKESLNKWISYLSSEDAMYPTWAKYWAFNSVLGMGKFEKIEDKETGVEKAQFRKRAKDTVSSFAPLNPRALAMTIGAIESKAEENSKNKNERVDTENVSVKLDDAKFKELLNTENFSKIYCQFLMEMPEYSIEGLRETRGKWVKYNQGSEPDELVKSLDGHPLEWCTANIDTARTQLQGGDFHVYYSINELGEEKIPRVAIRMDGSKLAEVRGIAADQNIDPYISDVVKEKMSEFPDGKDYEKKSVDMKRLTGIEERYNSGQELTKEDLRFLYEFDSKIEGFGSQKDPRIKKILNNRDIKSDLSLISGFSKEEISTTKEEALGGNTKFHYGDLDLNGLTSAEGLVLPETINGSLDLRGLTSAEGLVLPETINWSLNLNGLTSAEGLVLPETVGNLYLRGLTSAEGLVLPETINWSLNLGGLKSVKGLILPETVESLNLSGLTSAEGLVLPETVGDLGLSGLTSAEGLVLPETINGSLDLRGLTSAEGLVLPETISGYLELSGLTSAEKDILKQRYPNIQIY